MKFKLILPILTLAGIGVLGAGCAGIRIYDSNQDVGLFSQNRIYGIPFNVKIPVIVQTTQITIKAVSLLVTIKSGKTVVNHPSIPVVVPSTPELLAKTADLINYINSYSKKGDGAALIKEIDSKLAIIETDSAAEINNIENGKASSAAGVTSNTMSVDTILEPKRYYIEPVTPLFGSNDASFEFASDGTLTKAETKIQDDTAKTLLGLLPIQPLLANQWLGKAKIQPFGGPRDIKIEISMTVADASAVYTLKKLTEVVSGTEENQNMKNLTSGITALKISDAKKDKAGVQLVSVTPASKKPEEKEKPAYEISGKIVLPDASGTSSKK